MTDLARLAETIGDLDEGNVLDILNDFTGSQDPDVEAAIIACQKGLEIVGDRFEKEEYFLADLIFAGNMIDQAFAILKPMMKSKDDGKLGTLVLCTVEGDLHDLGKNIVKVMIEAAGFKVLDLGTNVSPDVIIATLQESGAKILGLSGVLTLAIDHMKQTVKALENAGLRKDVKVIIGGAPIDAESCKMVGADAWNRTIGESIKICREWATEDLRSQNP